MEKTLSLRIPEKILVEMRKYKVDWNELIVRAIEKELKRLSVEEANPQPAP
jgi:hypothetical protein